MSLSIEEARRHARPLGVLVKIRGNKKGMSESLEELQEQAGRLRIFGWQDMDAEELRAAIETAEQEADFADTPTEQQAQATRAERGEV